MARVLVVDHDPEALKAVHLVLREARHAVATAAAGTLGVEIAKEFGPDVALIEIELPDITGFEVLGAIREDWPGVEGVMMTSNWVFELATRVANVGAGWLSKPIDEEELRDAVRSHVMRIRQRGARELNLLPMHPHDYARLAEVPIKYLRSRRDHRTIRQIGTFVGSSEGKLNLWCDTARCSSIGFRDFIRGFRAVYRLEHEPDVWEEGLLDIKDDRSLRKFRVRAGGSEMQLPKSVDEYLTKQRFVPVPQFIEAVRQALLSAEIRFDRPERTFVPRDQAADGRRTRVSRLAAHRRLASR